MIIMKKSLTYLVNKIGLRFTVEHITHLKIQHLFENKKATAAMTRIQKIQIFKMQNPKSLLIPEPVGKYAKSTPWETNTSWSGLLKSFATLESVDVVKLKWKIHPKTMLMSDVRSDKIGKNAVDRFSISLLVLKIFVFKVEKLVIWRPPFWYANEGDMTSQLQEWNLMKYHFAYIKVPKYWKKFQETSKSARSHHKCNGF